MNWIHHTCHLVNRDYFGCLNLISELSKLGVKTTLCGTKVEGQKPLSSWKLCCLHRPPVVILPKLIDAPRFRAFVKENAKNYNPFVIILPTEFGEYSSNPEARINSLLQSHGKRDGSGANILLAISEAEKKSILQLYDGLSPDDIFVTGNPRYDIFDSSYSFFRPSKSEISSRLNIPENQAIITLFTSYSFADFHDKYDSTEYKSLVKHFTTQSIWEESRVRSFIESTYIMREETVKATLALSKAFPDTCVVVKTHPDEDINFYVSRLENKGNIRIVKNFLSSDLIPHSSFHVHHFCTTALEANLCQTQYCHFQLNNVDDVEHKTRLKDASPQCNSTDELVEMAKMAIAGQSVSTEKSQQCMQELMDYAFDNHIGRGGRNCANEILKQIPPYDTQNEASLKTCDSFLRNYHTNGFYGESGSKPPLIKRIRFGVSKILGLHHFPFMYFSSRFPSLESDLRRFTEHTHQS